jgi:hypothetical protein
MLFLRVSREIDMRRLFAFLLVGTSAPFGPALAGNGTVTVEPFTAYYGERGDLRIVGSGVDSPMALPHHIGCPDQTGESVDAAIQKICGSNARAYYNSIGVSGGNHCGYNVIAGVCVRLSQ